MKGLRPQESFVYPVIDDRPLWPKRVPSGEQCDGEHGEGKFPFVYVDVSFEIRAAASPPKKGPAMAPNEPEDSNRICCWGARE